MASSRPRRSLIGRTPPPARRLRGPPVREREEILAADEADDEFLEALEADDLDDTLDSAEARSARLTIGRGNNWDANELVEVAEGAATRSFGGIDRGDALVMDDFTDEVGAAAYADETYADEPTVRITGLRHRGSARSQDHTALTILAVGAGSVLAIIVVMVFALAGVGFAAVIFPTPEASIREPANSGGELAEPESPARPPSPAR